MKYLLSGEQTDRLTFRAVSESDFNDWLIFFADPRTSVHWIEEKKTPAEECTRWYERQRWRYEHEMGGMNALIEKTSGRLVGHAGLVVQTVDNASELEIAYSLLPEFWNKGYASEAAEHCKNVAFENDFTHSLISIISKTNIPSQRVALRNGMQIDKSTIYKGNEVYIFRVNRFS